MSGVYNYLIMYAEKLFEIWGIGPNLYGIMIAVGLICCMITLNVAGKRVKMSEKAIEFYEINAFISIALGFLSAALFQYVYDLIKFGSSAKFGGMTFLGGLIGGVAVFLIITVFFAKPEYKAQFPKLLQVGISCVLIAHAFGRVGCFFSGCCYGVHVDPPIGLEFKYGASAGTGAVLPTNLYEAIFLFLMYGVSLMLMYKKKPISAPYYLIVYGLFRFIIEYFRGDDRGMVLSWISPSQFWCVLMIVGGVALITIQMLHLTKPEVRKRLPTIISNSMLALNTAYDKNFITGEGVDPSLVAPKKKQEKASADKTSDAPDEQSKPAAKRMPEPQEDGFDD